MNDHDQHQTQAIQRVKAAINTIKSGGMIILTDDESRENEGDIVFAAQDVNPEKINFMAKEARGLICLTLEPSIVNRLQLPLMSDTSKSRTPFETAFTVSIEAKTGITTGISAADRARTVSVAIDEKTTPNDIVVPGHIFPLKARSGGVLTRTGHTEGSTDLARIAGKKPAAVICEIMKDNGEMARGPDLEIFSKKFDLPIVSIADIITFRLQHESLIEEVGRRPFKTQHGTFEGIWFRNFIDKAIHFALVKGDSLSNHCVDVRVHKQRPLEDLFGLEASSTSELENPNILDYGLKLLKNNHHACLIYLMDHQPNESLLNALNKKSPQMDPKLYGIGAQILKKIGVNTMRLHVRSDRTLNALRGFGLEIVSLEVMNGK